MITIFVIAIGDVKYKQNSIEILKDYFSNKMVNLFILEEDDLSINYKNAHPSWLKLLSHKYTQNDDFTICLDLDLLPINSEVDLVSHFNLNKLNMTYDTSVVCDHARFNNNFYYNGGLIGIPYNMRDFCEEVYTKHSPGTYPSYEQYYLNDEIASKKIEIHNLPIELNAMYPQTDQSYELFVKGKFLHYTWGCNDQERISLIEKHKQIYFNL